MSRRRHVVIGDNTIPSVGQTYTDSATVRAVQQALKDKGYSPGGVDGILGPNTAAAVKKLQADIGEPQTGQIDYGVISALGVSTTAGNAAGQVASDQAAVQAATQASHDAYNPTIDVNQFVTATPTAWGLGTPKLSLSLDPASAPVVPDATPAQVQQAQTAVATAKTKVAAAKTPIAAAQAQQQLVVAQKHLDAIAPSFLEREFLGRPVWQIGLGVVGVTFLTLGLVTLLGGKKKRK